MNCFGRRKIKTDIPVITAENVCQVLADAYTVHMKNKGELEYLWKIYIGNQPIRCKVKEFRENINNVICENRAAQIVEFYLGYVFGEPIQYVRAGKDETLNDDVEELNRIMASKDKMNEDTRLAEWMLVGGVCPRLVLPDKNDVFNIYTLSPTEAFNVYYNGLGEPVVMSVKYVTHKNGDVVFSVYTKDRYFEISNGKVQKSEAHILGEPPIEEYCLNTARLGIFEPVITLLEALNTLESNRMDDVQQFVNNILCILGGQISDDTLDKMREYGALTLPEGVDAKYLTAVLSQSDVQVFKDDILSAIIEITGMPNRNGGTSTSDTGSAVLLRDGWETADAKSKLIEQGFKPSDRRVLKKVLNITGQLAGSTLNIQDIEIKFTRRNYEAIATKSSVLTTLLSRIPPRQAYIYCGLFSDPEAAYGEYEEWKKEQDAKAAELMAQRKGVATDDNEGNQMSEV